MLSKEEFIEKINNSPVLRMRAEDDEEQYIIERNKLCTDLCIFLRLYWFHCEPEDYNDYTGNIFDTIDPCLKSYNAEQGAFINYFITSYNRKSRTALAIEKTISVRSGIHLPRNDNDTIRAILGIAKVKQYDLSDDEDLKKIANILGKDLTKIKELVLINERAKVLSESVVPVDNNMSEEEVSLFDSISDSISPEDARLLDVEIDRCLEALDEVYLEAQDRTKPKYAALITNYAMEMIQYRKELVNKHFTKREFFSEKISLKVVKICLYRGRPIPQKKFAEAFGVSEVAITKIVNQIKDKIKAKLLKKE